MNEFTFYISIKPQYDLRPLEVILEESDLGLRASEAICDGKFIIPIPIGYEDIDWNMDFPRGNEYIVTGSIRRSFEDSKKFMIDLSETLESAEMMYEILMEYDNGESTFRLYNII